MNMEEILILEIRKGIIEILDEIEGKEKQECEIIPFSHYFNKGVKR